MNFLLPAGRDRNQRRSAEISGSWSPSSTFHLPSSSAAAEAWRRAEAGEPADEELYCCDAQWSGLYDRMHTHEPDEIERHLALAADFGEAAIK